jgi:hypothetical protein
MGRITPVCWDGRERLFPLDSLLPLFLSTASSHSNSNHHLHLHLHPHPLPSNYTPRDIKVTCFLQAEQNGTRKGELHPQSTYRRSHHPRSPQHSTASPTRRGPLTGHFVSMLRLGLRFKQIPFRGAGSPAHLTWSRWRGMGLSFVWD